MKLAFCTCVKLGESCIKKIYEIGGTLDLLITYKDYKCVDKSGRVYLDSASEQHNIPLLKINSINDREAIETIKAHDIDWLFIIGWSQIARKDVLAAPKKGCIGMHPMLLPKGRGRAAIPWAIIKGLSETGVTMFKLDENIDTGDIIGQVRVPINEKTTATELYQRIDKAHTELIAQYWSDIVNERVVLHKQDNSIATVWEGRTPADGEIFSSMTMLEADRLVRAVTHPYPGAFFSLDSTKRILIWSAKTDKEYGRIKLADGFLEPIDFDIEDLVEEEKEVF